MSGSSGPAGAERPGGTGWAALDAVGEPCAVVDRRMKVLYLNPTARGLAPGPWSGRHCWDVLPVTDRRCASDCPAVRAVALGELEPGEAVYAEEAVLGEGGTIEILGAAAVGLPEEETGARALLVFRAPSEAGETVVFRAALLDRAREIYALLVVEPPGESGSSGR